MKNNSIINFDASLITNPEQSLPLEWLETNGLGSYAMSTIYCCHSRKYHGLLIATLDDRNAKISFLSKYITTVRCKGVEFELSTNKYPGVYHPTGHKYLHSFTYENNYPQLMYDIGGGLKIKKSILMIYEQNTVLVKYDVIEAPGKVTFENNPLLSFRDVNGLHHNNLDTQNYLVKERGQWAIQPYSSLPILYFKLSIKSKYFDAPDTYDNVEYLKEQQRGYDFTEDLFTPGVFETKVKEKKSLIIQASLHKSTKIPAELWDEEIKRRKAHNQKINQKLPKELKGNDSYAIIKQKADQYLITDKRAKAPSIIAGYPWFGEWGRDTMISVSGLTLYAGKEDMFIPILETYTKAEKHGVFPNQYSKTGESSYNCVDASLWFFRAISQYLDYYKNSNKAITTIKKSFGKPMKSIISSFVSNKTPNIHVFEDGYIAAGNEMTQLTWMDANAYGKPVTSRHGLPIEINALWYLAIKTYSELFPTEAKKDIPQLIGMKENLEKTFKNRYYIESEKYLADNILNNNQVYELRPNQLVALSIPELVDKTTTINCLESIKKHLLTPVGLRSLDCRHPSYKARCRGFQDDRDSAYHQGTVWPFLIGLYTDTTIRIGKKKDMKELYELLLKFIERRLADRGIGMISEIYDGNSPHKYRGCPGQAWSIAEIVRSIELLTKIINNK